MKKNNVTTAELRSRIDVAAGNVKADIVLKNARIVNVFTEKIEEADIAILGDRIVGIGRYHGGIETDLEGKYVCPGFLDGHIHLESSMISPREFECTVLPHGTTAVITDPHEITNVAGEDGLHYILDETEGLTLNVYVMMPSCVPCTAIDESGAIFEAKDILPWYEHGRVLGLAEMMNSVGVVGKEKDILQKIADAKNCEKLIDGHAPLLSEKDLNAYAGSGVLSDHECSNAEEAFEKLSLGQWIMIREGTAARNLEALISLCEAPYYQRCMFVTDDRHPGDLIEKGHIDYIIRKAIRLGADPIRAIKMATWNPAQYFRLHDRGAVAPGYLADLVILESLEDVRVCGVYKNGKPALEAEEAPPLQQENYPRVWDSFHMPEVTEQSLTVDTSGSLERVIELIPGELLTRELLVPKIEKSGFPVGVDPDQDILKAVVFERHKNTGHRGVGFIKGYGIKKGAVASSVAHDSHNLIVIGAGDRDITLAANCVRKNGGGLAVVIDGKVAGELPLPIAGLMSELSAEETEERLETLKELCRDIGLAEGIDPFMTLGFVSLPVIPQLRLTTRGIVDVGKQEMLEAFF
ncbi:MAG: adenine deaminase [Lachnospiraceae bacterium]|nr:adenine deaminase [Lachnospiraceae bacterium]